MAPFGASRAGLMSVAADDIPDSVASRPDDDQTRNVSSEQGLTIEIKDDWPSIGVEISELCEDFTKAYLREMDGTLIEDIDIAGLSSNESFTFDDVNLEDGNKYTITMDAEGSDYTVGRLSSFDYPYTSDFVDIVADQTDSDNEPRGFVKVGNVGF